MMSRVRQTDIGTVSLSATHSGVKFTASVPRPRGGAEYVLEGTTSKWQLLNSSDPTISFSTRKAEGDSERWLFPDITSPEWATTLEAVTRAVLPVLREYASSTDYECDVIDIERQRLDRQADQQRKEAEHYEQMARLDKESESLRQTQVAKRAAVRAAADPGEFAWRGE
jgi:hypothetical protein